MTLITNQNAENLPLDSSGQIGTVKPVDRIDAQQANKFSDLMEDEENISMKESASEGEISPEELQRQIREGLFKSGFNKAMEKAKEIVKEMKE